MFLKKLKKMNKKKKIMINQKQNKTNNKILFPS